MVDGKGWGVCIRRSGLVSCGIGWEEEESMV